MIEIKNLRKEFNHDVIALDNFSLKIEDGEFIALLGPSGCGKSTTLNCISGLMDPTSGEILFNGQDVTHLEPRDRNIGMVFQSYALYPHLSVLENIAFPLKQKKVCKETRYKKATEVAKVLQIEHLLGRKPHELSGGQQQRVALCRAIVKEPHVLLLDEPMSNLDARLKIEIREVIKDIHQKLGITSIIVTHDQEEAMALADRIAILDCGRTQQFDTPDNLYEKPVNLFVANFMGNPPMNFIKAKLDGSKIKIGDISFESSVILYSHPNEADIKLGVRSHQISFSLDKTTKTPIRMELRNVENLGKELLVYGYVDVDNEIRVSVIDKGMYQAIGERIKTGREGYIGFGSRYNVFLLSDGNNIVNFGCSKDA
ncbi:ABC transporter ATP-binding protein [Treponema parvum]|uniref:ABC transporter ATP-binding protein n=1 Tax=Treponema parvum TaxID=138851 RepID=A0A975EZ57_9SPIR|nr:ABC transporter ATP-binding protein [Treponema parvum]QTQ11079.1 ABC transporter ATP-binding protein [Treponema parvum]